MRRSVLFALLATAAFASPAAARRVPLADLPPDDAPAGAADGKPLPPDDPVGPPVGPIELEPPAPPAPPRIAPMPIMVEPVNVPPAPVPRDGELVVNGSFESPALADGSWSVFADIAGWHTSSGPGIEIQRGVAGAPYAGAQHVELDSDASSSMYQVLPTVPGATYLVTYRVSPRPGVDADDNALEVRWDGALVDRYASDRVVGETEWELRAVLVTARSRATRLELADASRSDSLGAYVDDVSVKLVGRAPAPPPYRPHFALRPR
ncbi:MAG TPA: hypothetical protein VHE35_16415 [Kofleriaceae bacterium]|nr:hypothetical protein [Kofleriaceae bacterium]